MQKVFSTDEVVDWCFPFSTESRKYLGETNKIEMSSEATSKPKATFYELCRLCLELPGIRTFEENKKLLDDIYYFTGVKVSSTDNLPQSICKQCLRTIKKMKALKTLTKTNDTHLRFLFDEDEMPSNDDQPGNSSPSKEIDSTTKSTSSKGSSCHNDNLKTTGEKGIKKLSPKIPFIAVRKDLFTDTVNSLKDNLPEKTKDLQSKKSLKQRLSDLIPSPSEEPPDLKNVKAESSSKDSEYKCRKCHKQFTEWKKFYHHQRQHIRSVMCPFDACLKKFTTKNDLAKHVRTHTGEKPYKCSFCEKSFTQNVTMKQHELCHYKKKKQPKADY